MKIKKALQKRHGLRYFTNLHRSFAFNFGSTLWCWSNLLLASWPLAANKLIPGLVADLNLLQPRPAYDGATSPRKSLHTLTCASSFETKAVCLWSTYSNLLVSGSSQGMVDHNDNYKIRCMKILMMTIFIHERFRVHPAPTPFFPFMATATSEDRIALLKVAWPQLVSAANWWWTCCIRSTMIH